MRRGLGIRHWLFAFFVSQWIAGNALGAQRPYGLESLRSGKAFRSMPPTESGPFPQHLSETGVFADVRSLTLAEGMIPYELNVSFFSDGAQKLRWVSPAGSPEGGFSKIGFSATNPWKFTPGTIFVKHFNLTTDETHSEGRHRLETRLLVCTEGGGVYGVTYKWRADNSDADLLSTNLWESILVRTATGIRTQQWYYPSRQDCRTCHTDLAGGVLGVRARQLNRDATFPGGATDNELRVWNHLGLFEPALNEIDIPALPRLSRAGDVSRPIEDRARSYLDANCSHCHRPGGTVAYFDTRFETPLEQQNLIGGPVLIDQGIDKARIIAPNDIWRSIAYLRISHVDSVKMPPIAHERLDAEGAELIKEWIESLPGPTVLDPPAFAAERGRNGVLIKLRLTHRDPGAVIHYTVDGTAPTASDPIFERALELTGPTMVRARAYKPGFTKSIAVQQLFGESN